jgi:hypothetical protein
VKELDKAVFMLVTDVVLVLVMPFPVLVDVDILVDVLRTLMDFSR